MSISDFTYSAYREMLKLIKNSGYSIVGYDEHAELQKKCILRHDIDTSIDKAIRLAELEYEQDVCSTYFVLVKTDLYNPFSARSEKMLKQIDSMGHTIGLHFDEMAYPHSTDIPQAIQREADMLSQIVAKRIGVVSMHRPSKAMLEANYRIDDMINSYSDEYFRNYKYISDSRRRWHENVEDIIICGKYPNLHILTHAMWYNENTLDISESLRTFIKSAVSERYDSMSENLTDLESVLKREEL